MMMTNPIKKPLIGSLRDLEYRLGIKREELLDLIRSRDELYCPYDTPKKKHPYPGKQRLAKLAAGPVRTRHIDNPVPRLKDIQRKILKQILCNVQLPDFMFGAVAGKSLSDHAKQHVVNQSSTMVKLDITSYYPNVTCDHVYAVWNSVLGCPPRVAKILTELTTFEFHLPQGAPTSPYLANIVLASIYQEIRQRCQQKGLTNTTWVDDLNFSGKDSRAIMEPVREVLASHGFKIAPSKYERRSKNRPQSAA